MTRIVVCPEPLAANAGAEIFQRGGSAIDAAIATAYAQTVVAPEMTSIAGNGVMNVFHAPSGQNVVVDFLGQAGSLSTPEMFAEVGPEGNWLGYPAILIPTFVRATYEAFARFGSGRVSWAAVLEPAIRYAEEGFAVYPYMHQYWRAENPVIQSVTSFDGYRMLTETAACAAIFTTQGRVHNLGERIVQPDLARSLRRIAEHGPDEFYTGEIGRRMAEDFERNGAPITADDLAAYRASFNEPIRGSYRGYAISADAPPNIGGLLIELLNILEGFDVRDLGWATADYFDVMARALGRVFQDRERFMTSTDPAAVEQMVSKAYAAEVRAHLFESSGGPAAAPAAPEGTTHVTTFDDDGSAVSFTHTIGLGGGVVTPGLGFLYNNNMHAFDTQPGRPNSVAPGKRPITGGGPTIVFQDGRVRAVLGSPHGSRKTSSMGHVLVALLDVGLSAAAAVASPRIHIESDPREIVTETYFPLPLPIEAGLKTRGYRLREHQYGGRVCLVDVDPASGRARGASDPRGGGGLIEL